MYSSFAPLEHSQLALSNLLSHLSYITSADVAHAQQLASTTGLPLGKCFVLLDCISQDELLQVLEAQALLQDNVISLEQFVKALESVRRGWTLIDALTMQGLDAHSTRRTRLGELLTDAGAINANRLTYALRIGEFTSLPLGRILTSFNAIDVLYIQLALKIQTSIRKGGLDREAAIQRLESIAKPPIENVHLKLGELLIHSGIITPTQMMETLAVAENSSRLVGEVLIESGKVPEEVIATSLRLQELLDASLIDLESAISLINKVIESIKSGRGEPLASSTKMTYLRFMRAAGYLDDEKLTELLDETGDIASSKLTGVLKIGRPTRSPASLLELNRSPDDSRQTLLTAFPADKQLINSGMVIFELVRSGKLQINQGLVVFGFRQRDLVAQG